MAVRILICGSCVSRDILNGEVNGVELSKYFARSSFASAFSKLPCQDSYSSNLESDFQRRTVAADFSKELPRYLKDGYFDLILVDFIDERFDLFIYNDGGICTVSNELISAGFNPKSEGGQVIKSGSDEFFHLWEYGWKRFINIADDLRFRHKIRINKVFWASMTTTGKGFKTYSNEYIQASNDNLSRLYNRVANDIWPWQFITANPKHLIADEDHRWGISPFHYIQVYYNNTLSELINSIALSASGCSVSGKPVVNFDYPFDRNPVSYQQYSSIESSGKFQISDCRTSGNGVVEYKNGVPKVQFSPEAGTHQLIFRLTKPMIANGLCAKIRIKNWSTIRYIAFGYTYQGAFRHIKVVNPPSDEWFTVALLHGDIGYGLQNDWSHPPATEISDVRIYLKGESINCGGTLEVENFVCWEEAENPATELTSATIPLALPDRTPVPRSLLDVLYGYLRKCFRHVQKQAEEFLQSGRCPLYGETQLEWPLHQDLPDGLSTVGTYAFSWHSLHPASILMVHSKNTGMDAPVFAAREMVTNWLEHSYYTPDPDKKFAWYDHGTAERQLAFILMWAEGIEREFDERFMSRLGGAIIRHAELLESEQFYASHQPTRYHNHAWFQDLALMATALALPEWPASRRYMQRATERLTDQLENLIVRDNGFSVFVENSIGYHQGVQRIVELACNMVRLTGVQSSIPEVAVELSRFSDFFRYPDNRAPAQGDTFRRSNSQGDEVCKLKPYPQTEVVVLPEAGYGIVKGNHDGARFMFCMFATSLCRTHKHEDNLSFTLFFDGLEWLIDPSFFSHEYKSSIPAYLRSAAAHNGLFIDDKPYTIDPGYSTLQGKASGDLFEFKGKHNCYTDIVFLRTVRGASNVLAFEFEDEVKLASQDEIVPRLMLHCGEGVEAFCSGRVLTLSHRDSKYRLTAVLPSNQIKISKGVIDGDYVRGISGTSFMQMSEIFTVEVVIPCNAPIKWSLVAQKC